MFLTFLSFLLAPLFVFGVYHLLTWVNLLRMNERVYWKQVAIASAVSHVLLVTGFLIFAYFDFQAHLRLEPENSMFGPFLFNRSNFWRLMTIFDTAPMFVILIVFSIMARADINPPGLVAVTFAITYIVGTLQWFLIGGAAGAILERFWAGLKTGDEEDEDWL